MQRDSIHTHINNAPKCVYNATFKKTIFCNICSIPAELTEKESTNLEKTAAPAAVASTERQMSACQLVIQSRLGPSQPNTAQRNTKIWNNITMQWDSNESGKLCTVSGP